MRVQFRRRGGKCEGTVLMEQVLIVDDDGELCELVARIHAILRRVAPRGTATGASQDSSVPEQIEVGDVSVDTGMRLVRRAGEPVELTNVEYEILVMLLSSAGRVVTREELVRS